MFAKDYHAPKLSMYISTNAALNEIQNIDNRQFKKQSKKGGQVRKNRVLAIYNAIGKWAISF
jgi:hypothetical protein